MTYLYLIKEKMWTELSSKQSLLVKVDLYIILTLLMKSLTSSIKNITTNSII